MKKLEPCENPNHKFNSKKYHTGDKCLECDLPAGTAWGPYWCWYHNAIRLNGITESLKSIAAKAGVA